MDFTVMVVMGALVLMQTVAFLYVTNRLMRHLEKERFEERKLLERTQEKGLFKSGDVAVLHHRERMENQPKPNIRYVPGETQEEVLPAYGE